MVFFFLNFCSREGSLQLLLFFLSSAINSSELRYHRAPPIIWLKKPVAKSFGHPKKQVASHHCSEFSGIQHGLAVGLTFNLK